MVDAAAPGRPAERWFDAVTHATWRRLPRGLRAWVPRTFVGFALINGSTFALDLALLAVLFDGLGVPYPVAVSAGYAVAFTLAFVLNRWLNFHAHGHLGGHLGRYAVVVAVNYVALILGLGSGLEAIGVPYVLARLVAGAAEALWMYSMMRWWVFRTGDRERPGDRSPLDTGTTVG